MCMNLGDIILSETNQTHRTILYDYSDMRSLEVSNAETESRWWGPGVGEGMGS